MSEILVRVIDNYTEFEQGSIQSVKSVHTGPEGDVYYFCDGAAGEWLSFHFEDVVLSQSYIDDIPSYEPPEPDICLPRSEVNQMLKDAQMLRALYSTGVRDWCNFSNAIDEYKRLEKENLE